VTSEAALFPIGARVGPEIAARVAAAREAF
jgi:hypothetical protein